MRKSPTNQQACVLKMSADLFMIYGWKDGAPLTMDNIVNSIGDFFTYIYDLLFSKNQYRTILEGLGNTLFIALFATLIGITIGIIIAIVKYFSQGNKKLWIADKLCNLFITVIRGTPVMVQLFIWALIIMTGVKNAMIIAIVGFGVNSGAYVAEIIRAGIAAVDPGQNEAGRSLGLSNPTTMRLIILPQAIKNILPALGNEFIVLLKETSVAGYIAVKDLTMAGTMIKNNTFDGNIYFVIAIIYLIIVMIMTKLLRILERRLARSDKN